MRIYTKAGDLAFKTFTFPDGQPHFKLETYAREFDTVNIETALKSPADLFLLGMVTDVLRQHGYSEINLDIRYLLAARMDRAISVSEPFSLQLVARFINSLGFSKVRILDVHSEVATKLIRNSENVLPIHAVEQVIAAHPNYSIVIPDKGAEDRVMKVTRGPMGYVRDVVRCEKKRDPLTGQLSGFKVVHGLRVGSWVNCLIIDDICDGGGTFTGIAQALRDRVAESNKEQAESMKVKLFVTHGIFSKGLPLKGIDQVFTTDSYMELHPWIDRHHSALSQETLNNFTVIPISMKELK